MAGEHGVPHLGLVLAGTNLLGLAQAKPVSRFVAGPLCYHGLWSKGQGRQIAVQPL